MTTKQVSELRTIENLKLDTLEQIVKLLETLEKAAGDEGTEAVDWVMEKLAE